MTDRYQQAEHDRQTILDLLNKSPMELHQLVCKLDDDYYNDERVAQILGRMEGLLEVSRSNDGIARNGRKCALWHAESKKTVSSSHIKEHITGNLKGPGNGRKAIRVGMRRPTAKALPKPKIFGGL